MFGILLHTYPVGTGLYKFWDAWDTWDRSFWRGSLSRSKLLLTWDSWDTWDKGFCAALALGFFQLAYAFFANGAIQFSELARKREVRIGHEVFPF